MHACAHEFEIASASASIRLCADLRLPRLTQTRVSHTFDVIQDGSLCWNGTFRKRRLSSNLKTVSEAARVRVHMRVKVRPRARARVRPRACAYLWRLKEMAYGSGNPIAKQCAGCAAGREARCAAWHARISGSLNFKDPR